MDISLHCKYQDIIDDVCTLGWQTLSRHDLLRAAVAYYFFSVQFRENLEIACMLHPDDAQLRQLHVEECDTANLSPWPGVSGPGEALNHDEFMRRSLELYPMDASERAALDEIGEAYLCEVRSLDPSVRALSIGSYEDGGLEKVFRAILGAPHWDGPCLQAFRHFLIAHIQFDSDPEHGHGALSRTLACDDRVAPLWLAFEQVLVRCAPGLQVQDLPESELLAVSTAV